MCFPNISKSHCRHGCYNFEENLHDGSLEHYTCTLNVILENQIPNEEVWQYLKLSVTRGAQELALMPHILFNFYDHIVLFNTCATSNPYVFSNACDEPLVSLKPPFANSLPPPNTSNNTNNMIQV